MARISYTNGQYVLHADAMVNIEDRGYQFADGVYEYVAYYNGRMLDPDLHFARLERSMQAISLIPPMSLRAFSIVSRELIERNGRPDGGLYIQVTRGVARRDHPFPKNTKPALSMTVCGAKIPKPHEVEKGVQVMTSPDIRWIRRDIKSISLLANVLAKNEASQKKMRESWFYLDDGRVTEGSASNAYIVNDKGELITHPADTHILGGVTRDVVLRLARNAGITVAERPFTLSEIKTAREAFITSTSANVLPVVKVDDITIGNGKPGEVAKKLLSLYHGHIFAQTGKQF